MLSTRTHWLIPLLALPLVAVDAYLLGFLPVPVAALIYVVRAQPPRRLSPTRATFGGLARDRVPISLGGSAEARRSVVGDGYRSMATSN